jgi:type III pantothenate kinase
VGNTRIKWGRCRAGRVEAVQGVPHEAPEIWAESLREWKLPVGSVWVLTGVHPRARDGLADWLRRRGEQVRAVLQARELPLRVELEKPDHAGIDRLLNAVAVNGRRRSGCPAVIVDAGSAVTVDLVDCDGAFRGGAILPGLRLMARSLHDYTALLPLIDLPVDVPPYPGAATRSALEVGIFWAVAGGIQGLIDVYRRDSRVEPEIYLTGGDAELLARGLPGVISWPTMTLEGVRMTAETLA